MLCSSFRYNSNHSASNNGRIDVCSNRYYSSHSRSLQLPSNHRLTSLIFALVYTDIEREPAEEFAKLVTVGKVCLTHFMLSIGLSFYVFFFDPRYIVFLANVMGILGAILAMLQYFPQIYTTFTLKHAGSLSIAMMLLQTPGGFVFTASLAAREGTTWSSWLPYLTAATLQGIVLILAVYYETRNKEKHLDRALTEQTPLIVD